MIEEQEVFEAVRRGYGNLSDASDSEVVDYFGDIDDESWTGHLNSSLSKSSIFPKYIS